jgi:RND family efflux transporter MFP subunit
MMNVILILSTALLLWSCQANEPAVSQSTAPATVAATTATAVEQTIPVWLTTGGVVTTDHRVTISSRLSGYIRKLNIHEGQSIHKDDLLFRIDPVDVKQALAQAQADAANALADKRRFAALLKAQAVTQQQYDTVALRYTVAQSRVKQARNQLHYTNVRAPLDGVVVSKLLHNGDLASPGQAVLVIENPQQLLVETHVAESQVTRLHEGDSAQLQFTASNVPVMATIDHIIEDNRAASHQFLVKLSLQDQANVRPGMFAHIRFHQGQRQALMIPHQAVVYRNGLTGVYVVDANALLHYRLVRLGEVYGKQVEVSTGLHADERLIATITPELHSGLRLAESKHE